MQVPISVDHGLDLAAILRRLDHLPWAGKPQCLDAAGATLPASSERYDACVGHAIADAAGSGRDGVTQSIAYLPRMQGRSRKCTPYDNSRMLC